MEDDFRLEDFEEKIDRLLAHIANAVESQDDEGFICVKRPIVRGMTKLLRDSRFRLLAKIAVQAEQPMERDASGREQEAKQEAPVTSPPRV
jgi:hypothetical protein